MRIFEFIPEKYNVMEILSVEIMHISDIIINLYFHLASRHRLKQQEKEVISSFQNLLLSCSFIFKVQQTQINSEVK